MNAFTPMRAEADLLAQRIAHGDMLIEASKRAARIVDRVMPAPRTGRSAVHDPAGFMANSFRIGERNDLYKVILPRMETKVFAAAEAALLADIELEVAAPSEGRAWGRAA